MKTRARHATPCPSLLGRRRFPTWRHCTTQTTLQMEHMPAMHKAEDETLRTSETTASHRGIWEKSPKMLRLIRVRGHQSWEPIADRRKMAGQPTSRTGFTDLCVQRKHWHSGEGGKKGGCVTAQPAPTCCRPCAAAGRCTGGRAPCCSDGASSNLAGSTCWSPEGGS